MKPGCSCGALTALFLFVPSAIAVPFSFTNSSAAQTSAAQVSPNDFNSSIVQTSTSASAFPLATMPSNSTTPTNQTAALDPNAMNCQLALPANALTAEGLSTPWELLPPCSQSVSTQQSFAEAAIIDATGQISIYHPLIIDQGKTPAVAPVVPKLGQGAQVALFFGFNGGNLVLVDTNGQDSNASPSLADMKCVNGLPGVEGDVFGQVSWCNTDAFWNAANAMVASGQTQVPPLGTDSKGNQCLSSRSFEIIDQDQSDNLPTKYLLMPDGSTIQFTAANQQQFPQATEIDNASDEALIADFVDPVIGCTPYKVPSLDDGGVLVSSLATQEFQALLYQQEPIALIPLNDPDTVLTSDGAESPDKTNAYRIGVNMPLLGTGKTTDDGSGAAYCNNLIAVQPPFLGEFQEAFTNSATPDDTVGNNLFTFLANRFLQSLTNLGCNNTDIPVSCQLDSNDVATSCTVTVNGTGTGTPSSTPAAGATASSSSTGTGGGFPSMSSSPPTTTSTAPVFTQPLGGISDPSSTPAGFAGSPSIIPGTSPTSPTTTPPSSAVPSSGAGASSCTAGGAATQNCWQAFGWQLCRIESASSGY